MKPAKGHPTDLISAKLDGALSAAERERLEAHLAVCTSCRALESDLRALETARLAGAVPAVPAGLAERVREAVRREPMAAGEAALHGEADTRRGRDLLRPVGGRTAGSHRAAGPRIGDGTGLSAALRRFVRPLRSPWSLAAAGGIAAAAIVGLVLLREAGPPTGQGFGIPGASGIEERNEAAASPPPVPGADRSPAAPANFGELGSTASRGARDAEGVAQSAEPRADEPSGGALGPPDKEGAAPRAQERSDALDKEAPERRDSRPPKTERDKDGYAPAPPAPSGAATTAPPLARTAGPAPAAPKGPTATPDSSTGPVRQDVADENSPSGQGTVSGAAELVAAEAPSAGAPPAPELLLREAHRLGACEGATLAAERVVTLRGPDTLASGGRLRNALESGGGRMLEADERARQVLLGGGPAQGHLHLIEVPAAAWRRVEDELIREGIGGLARARGPEAGRESACVVLFLVLPETAVR